MATSSGALHEAADQLPAKLVDRHRAIVSIIEELEAIDWYDQRVAATADPELAAVLAHNRDEEKEHAAMTLEWLRRHDPVLDEQLRTYLFTSKPVLEVEEGEAAQPESGTQAASGSSQAECGSLGLGSLHEGTKGDSA